MKLLIVAKITLPKKKIIFESENKTLNNVLENVSLFTKIPISEIKSKTRKREIADARAIYYSFCYNYVNKSLYDISSYFGQTHASVIYANGKTQTVIKNEYQKFLKFVEQKGMILNKVNRELITNKN